jgi:hypothetical protein
MTARITALLATPLICLAAPALAEDAFSSDALVAEATLGMIAGRADLNIDHRRRADRWHRLPESVWSGLAQCQHRK